MEVERPEYAETKSARRKSAILFIAALVTPVVLAGVGLPQLGPYAFAAGLVAASFYLLTVETDRLHRRVDAQRDGFE